MSGFQLLGNGVVLYHAHKIQFQQRQKNFGRASRDYLRWFRSPQNTPEPETNLSLNAKRWLEHRDEIPVSGNNFVIFRDPNQLLKALACLIPHAKKHTVRYYGAAHHAIYKRYGLRPNIAPHQRKLPRHIRRMGHKRWARQLWLVYGVDAISCSRCPGKLEQFCEIFDADAIEKILAHLGYPTEVPKAKPARAPPSTPPQNASSKQGVLFEQDSEEESSHPPSLELQKQALNQEPPFEFQEEDFNQEVFPEDDFNQDLHSEAFPEEDFNQEVFPEEDRRSGSLPGSLS